ncbi:hypothetical protein [Microbacterium sp. cx-59]|uniref:hypothetical protein n=1 Tax=Microbacterium sp. cx-59 TaxID=2891207 RepID=UPI001E393212|nr:hypothetical protein [Microbacterium sp. cx-59]MCC4909795.1 hypothetical protein [Microbacterium sp. cx-59]
MIRSGRARTVARASLAGVVAFAAVLSVSVVVGGAAHADDGSNSAVTVSAKDQDIYVGTAPMPDLKVTVSQTTNLVAQAVTVSWTGGKESTLPSGQTGGENFLQIMQCWGDVVDDDAEFLPARTTCQFGAFGTPGAKREDSPSSAAAIAPEDARYSYFGTGGLNGSYTGIPFRSVPDPVTGDSKTIAKVDDKGAIIPGVNLNENEFFTKYTTNEVPWAGSGSNGNGSVTFELQTSLQSPGLGCGDAQTAADGAVTGRACWLVVVPRGAGTNTASPLFWEQWKHRVAVKLDFQPVGNHCAIGAGEQQLAGSELISDAVSSWQPDLCGAADGDAYTLITTTDMDAAAQSNTIADAPLTLTSQPLDTSTGQTDSLVYAPVALAGIAITFAVDRYPSASAPADVQEQAREPFTDMRLTPRLLAKLLTSSYTDALPTNAAIDYLQGNPRNILFDPEFLALNPTWKDQAIVSPAVADIMVPQGRSGYARAVWNYILADDDARAFLAGTPDAWGTRVNPHASTNAQWSGTQDVEPLELPRDDFPKADDAEAYAGEDRVLNSVTWRPYTNDLASGAYYALRGDGLNVGEWDPIAVPKKWTRKSRDLVGDRKVLAMTDTSASERYETVTASLLTPSGTYVSPTSDGLLAAAAVMTPSATQPQVYSFDAASAGAARASSAYPLAIPVYAATNATLNSADVNDSYARFIRFAATDGQTPGVLQGQLPAGYAPIPEGWRAQSRAAADLIQSDPVAAPAAPQPAPAAAAPVAAAPAAAAAAPVAAVPAVAADPSASGAPAAALSAGATPADPETGALAQAMPLSLLAGALAAGAVPFVGRLRRRL